MLTRMRRVRDRLADRVRPPGTSCRCPAMVVDASAGSAGHPVSVRRGPSLSTVVSRGRTAHCRCLPRKPTSTSASTASSRPPSTLGRMVITVPRSSAVCDPLTRRQPPARPRGCRSSRTRPGRRRISSSPSTSRTTFFATGLVGDRDGRLRHHRQLRRLDLEARASRAPRARRRAARAARRPGRVSRRARRRRRRASAAASNNSPSSTPSAGTSTTPCRSNCQATAPVAPRLPPCFEKACRTSDAVRLRLSVSASTSTATPSGPVALVDDRLERGAVRLRPPSPSRSRARCCPSASSTSAPSRSRSGARGSRPGRGHPPSPRP